MSAPFQLLPELKWPLGAIGVASHVRDVAYVSPGIPSEKWHCTVCRGGEALFTQWPIDADLIVEWLSRRGFETELARWRFEEMTPSIDAIFGVSTAPAVAKPTVTTTEIDACYFLQSVNGGPIKIGYSNDVQKRIETLQIGSPWPLRLLGVMTGGQAREAELHREFAHLRLHGEWFQADDELMDLILGEGK